MEIKKGLYTESYAVGDLFKGSENLRLYKRNREEVERWLPKTAIGCPLGGFEGLDSLSYNVVFDSKNTLFVKPPLTRSTQLPLYPLWCILPTCGRPRYSTPQR